MQKFNPTKIHPGLAEMMSKYTLIKDCIAGSERVKSKGILYLPKPDPTNLTEENTARYEQYIERAVFYGVTKHTVTSMVGMVFSREQPSLEVPDILSYLKDNVDGSGVSLEQQLKKVLFEQISIARAGLFVDYTRTEGQTTQEDITSGKVRPVIVRYDALDILWVETESFGVEERLSLIVLKDSYSAPTENGYTSKQLLQYKVLRLLNGVYIQEIWRDIKKDGWSVYDEHTPLRNNGRPFSWIPFTFAGALNNDSSHDDPPMLPIADLNIAHFRNSADAEESSFMSGQPTIKVKGLNDAWAQKYYPTGVVKVGSFGGILLPEGGDADLIQIKGTIMPENGMTVKESQMAALGAQLVTRQEISKTATEISRDSMIEDSVLSSIVRNEQQAYEFCFEQVTEFTGITGFDIKLNTKFQQNLFDSQIYISLTNGYLQNVNGRREIFDYLKSTNILDDDMKYDDWKDDIARSIPGILDA